MTIFYLDYDNGNDSNDGSTWALAWKTITSGATAARIAPGDTIRIAKSPAPTSIGNATWTSLSKVVTLATAQTLTIELCESVWTANGSGDVTPGVTAYPKIGTFAAILTFDSSPQTSIMQAYKATGTLNLSSYQKISFWFRNGGNAIVANNLKICLCSDTAGATPVDTFLIPAIPSTDLYVPLTLARVGGGNLGSSIQSIALYTDTVAPAGSTTILLDDFIACTTSGLTLQSLISKNSTEQGGTEGWYAVKSIDGTTINIDNATNTLASVGMGYSGTTGTVATYKRETIKTALASAGNTYVQEVQDSGSVDNNITFSGGWNTSNTTQDGETFFDGLNGNGSGIYISSKSYIATNHISCVRYYTGLEFSTLKKSSISVFQVSNTSGAGIYIGSSTNNTISCDWAIQTNFYGLNFSSSHNNTVTIGSTSSNNTCGVQLGYSNGNTLSVSNCINNADYGVYINESNNNVFKTYSSSSNASGSISNGGSASESLTYFNNALIAETTEVYSGTEKNSILFSNNHDRTAGNHWIFTDNGTINSQSTTRHTAAGIAWTLTPSNSIRDSIYPLVLSVAKIACGANATTTIKIWMIKGHATNVVGKLICRGGQLAGIPNDVTATKANDTNWEELSIQVTPTESGVINVDVLAYYASGTSTVTVDDLTVS